MNAMNVTTRGLRVSTPGLLMLAACAASHRSGLPPPLDSGVGRIGSAMQDAHVAVIPPQRDARDAVVRPMPDAGSARRSPDGGKALGDGGTHGPDSDAMVPSDAMIPSDGDAGQQLLAARCDMVQEDLLFMAEGSQAQVTLTEIKLTDFRQTNTGTLEFTIRSPSTPIAGSHYQAGATPGFGISGVLLTSNNLLNINDLNRAGELIVETFVVNPAVPRDGIGWLRSARIRLKGVKFTIYPSSTPGIPPPANGERWCTLPDSVIRYQAPP